MIAHNAYFKLKNFFLKSVLHWDRKLVPSVTYGNFNTLEDIVAFLVTGKEFENLLGVLVTKKHTYPEVAEAVTQQDD